MKSYKDPSFQDRVGRAAEARQRALDNLRAKAPVDQSVVAERQAARARREAAQAAARAAKKAAEQAAREKKAAASEIAAVSAPRSEAEMKAARDARYAARKGRK